MIILWECTSPLLSKDPANSNSTDKFWNRKAKRFLKWFLVTFRMWIFNVTLQLTTVSIFKPRTFLYWSFFTYSCINQQIPTPCPLPSSPTPPPYPIQILPHSVPILLLYPSPPHLPSCLCCSRLHVNELEYIYTIQRSLKIKMAVLQSSGGGSMHDWWLFQLITPSPPSYSHKGYISY